MKELEETQLENENLMKVIEEKEMKYLRERKRGR
jgi:hypothetical protein